MAKFANIRVFANILLVLISTVFKTKLKLKRRKNGLRHEFGPHMLGIQQQYWGPLRASDILRGASKKPSETIRGPHLASEVPQEASEASEASGVPGGFRGLQGASEGPRRPQEARTDEHTDITTCAL